MCVCVSLAGVLTLLTVFDTTQTGKVSRLDGTYSATKVSLAIPN